MIAGMSRATTVRGYAATNRLANGFPIHTLVISAESLQIRRSSDVIELPGAHDTIVLVERVVLPFVVRTAFHFESRTADIGRSHPMFMTFRKRALVKAFQAAGYEVRRARAGEEQQP